VVTWNFLAVDFPHRMLSTTGFFLIMGKFPFNALCSITVRSLLTTLLWWLSL